MFNIKIYLQGNIDFDILYGLLKRNNFKTISSRRIGMIDKTNGEHIKCAFVNNAILLSFDKSFQETKIKHKGILIVYKFADQKKEMTPVKIIKALKNLRKQIEENNLDLENKIYPLNIFVL